MARTQRHVTRTAAGGGGGTDPVTDPWTLDEAITNAASGDDVNLWNDGTPWSIGASKTFANAGTAAAPIRWRGLTTVAGDGWQGFDSAGWLVQTNMPVLNFSGGGARPLFSGNFNIIETFKVQVDNGTPFQISGLGCLALGMVGVNSNTGAGAHGISFSGTSARGYFCDGFQTGASGGAAAINNGQYCEIYGSRGNSISGAAFRSDYGFGRTDFVHCIGAGSVRGLEVVNTGASAITSARRCTFLNNSGDGVNVASGVQGGVFLLDNMITGNGGWGLQYTGTAAWIQDIRNRYRDNASGNVSIPGDMEALALLRIITDTGGDATDYVNAGGGDFRLVRQSPGHHWNVLRGLSLGACDPYAPTGGGLLGFGSA